MTHRLLARNDNSISSLVSILPIADADDHRPCSGNRLPSLPGDEIERGRRPLNGALLCLQPLLNDESNHSHPPR